MPKLRRRVRLALRQPTQWRRFRRQTEAYMNALDFRPVMTKAMIELITFGSATVVITPEGIDEMRKVVDTPRRKWFTLTKEAPHA